MKKDIACVARRSRSRFMIILHYPRPIQERQTTRTNSHITNSYWSFKTPKISERKERIRRKACLCTSFNWRIHLCAYRYNHSCITYALNFLSMFATVFDDCKKILEYVLAGPAGIEPTTYGLRVRRSALLSYGPTLASF